MNKGIENALKRLEIEYDELFYQQKDWEKDDGLGEKLEKALKSGKGYELVLSVNFAPLVSRVCENLGVRYVSWIYDSPLHIRNLEPLKNSCNEIYMFDRGEVEKWKSLGISAFHMPLAVDTDVFGEVIAGGKRRSNAASYTTDIALVGNLYNTKYATLMAPMSDYIKGYLEGMIASQSKVNGAYILDELVTDDLVEKINREYDETVNRSGGLKEDFHLEKRELEYMLACETTGRERYLAAALLSGHFSFDLYSTATDDRLKNINYNGYADYYTQMPIIFNGSRINLNIPLKTIRTGISLRVLDVLGCGGFLLTGLQAEMYEYFQVGDELVVYESAEDMYEKAAFYLSHDDLREKIATKGSERVKKDFTFDARLLDMLKVRTGK